MQRTVKIRVPGLIAALLLGVASMAPALASEFDGTKLVLEQYYLHGGDLDQVDKFTGDQPTFGQEVPTGDDEAVQIASGLPSAAGGAGVAYWVGEFTGTLEGDIEFTFFYRFRGGNMSFAVYADGEGPGTGNRIARAPARNVPQSVDADEPGVHTVSIPLEVETATVTQTLRIEIFAPLQVDLMPVYYDSENTDSGFVLPTIVPCTIGPSDPDCS